MLFVNKRLKAGIKPVPQKTGLLCHVSVTGLLPNSTWPEQYLHLPNRFLTHNADKPKPLVILSSPLISLSQARLSTSPGPASSSQSADLYQESEKRVDESTELKPRHPVKRPGSPVIEAAVRWPKRLVKYVGLPVDTDR